MQIREIINLMNHMKQADISKLEFESGGDVLRLERRAAAKHGSMAGPLTGAMPAVASAVGPAAGSAVGSASGLKPAVSSDAFAVLCDPSASTSNEPEDNAASWLVRSPVVGIYYASPAPDRDPFVQVGTTVEVGSTLCIIEAMKLMNEVNCNAEGKVLEIYAVNGQRVEYNQPLMRIGGC